MRRMPPLAGLVSAVLVALVAASAPPAWADGSAGASSSPAHTWSTNGRVSAILTVGSSVILGGDFTSVVDTNGRSFNANRLAKYVPGTGTFDTSWTPSVNGPVFALAASGNQVFVGGLFTSVAGSTKSALAAVSLSTGALDKTFTATTNQEVDALAVVGASLFLAGNFAKVTDSSGLTSRSYVAKVAIPSGTLDRTWAPVLAGRARALAGGAGGDTVYVGGDFTSVNAVSSAAKLTLLSTTTAAIDPGFRGGTTNQGARSPVLGLALSGSALLVAAAGSGGGCTRLNATSGATQWSKHTNGDVQSVAAFGPNAYCGGHFSGSASFEGLDREKLAAVDLVSGVTQSFNPIINSALGLWSMGTTPDALIVGGDFTKINTVLQTGVAQFRDTTALTAPTAPDGLAAMPGNNAVTLTWGVPSTDGGYQGVVYRIYRSLNGGAWTTAGTSSQESFTDTGVTNGTTYQFAVLAHNTAGDSPLSASVTATPAAGATTPPGVPASFRASGVVNAVQLSWGAPAFDGGSSLTGYRLLRSTTTGQETPLVDLPATATSYTDSGLDPSTRYYYTLQAVNSVGAGAPTTEQSALPTSGLPAAPVLTGTLNANHSVSLSWTLSSDGGNPISKYVVTRNGIRIGVVLAPSMVLTDSAPPSGSNSYQVRAVNAVGTSKLSNAVVFTAP